MAAASKAAASKVATKTAEPKAVTKTASNVAPKAAANAAKSVRKTGQKIEQKVELASDVRRDTKQAEVLHDIADVDSPMIAATAQNVSMTTPTGAPEATEPAEFLAAAEAVAESATAGIPPGSSVAEISRNLVGGSECLRRPGAELPEELTKDALSDIKMAVVCMLRAAADVARSVGAPESTLVMFANTAGATEAWASGNI